MERLLALLGTAVQLVYTCWDRIVINGYIDRLQRPANLIYFFHEVVGIDCIEPAVLEQRTNAYRAWVRRITEDQGIPVLAAPPAPPRGVRKEDFVQPFYRRLKGADGIACVPLQACGWPATSRSTSRSTSTATRSSPRS